MGLLKRGLPFRQLLVLLLASLTIIACSTNIRGDFGWSSHDDRDLQGLEQKLLIESEFRMGRKNLYFYDHETIWWIYQITDGLYFDDKFLAALYEDAHTSQSVILELRRATLLSGGCCDYIRHYYKNLKPGRYLLRIAYDSQTIDKVSFFVFPEAGPAYLGREASEETEEEADDIQYYSRSIFSRKHL